MVRPQQDVLESRRHEGRGRLVPARIEYDRALTRVSSYARSRPSALRNRRSSLSRSRSPGATRKSSENAELGDSIRYSRWASKYPWFQNTYSLEDNRGPRRSANALA